MALAPVAGNLPLCTHRYLMIVSYLGSKYTGSQRLTGRDSESTQNTVQEVLEWSLEKFLPKKRCKLTASSRTDKGVHALINCYTLPLMDFEMSTESFRRAVNQNLFAKHHDVCVSDVVLVPADYHPRKCALGREYIYRLAVFDKPEYHDVVKHHNPLRLMHLLPITEMYRTLPLIYFNYEKAQEVIELMNGEHDFASFAIKQENVPDTVRDMNITITKLDSLNIDHGLPLPYSLYQIRFKSRSFLYNQVRRMVGTLLTYASYDRIKIERIKNMLENPNSRNWTSKLIIAEPWGLYLSRIIYSRSSFKGAIKTMQDKTEVPVDEFNLPPHIQLTDQEPPPSKVEEEGLTETSDGVKEEQPSA